MLNKIKSALYILVCAAVVAQLGGCIFVEHDRRSRNRHHEERRDIQVHPVVVSPELDIHVR